MAITQARMIAAITTARTYHSEILRLRKAIRAACAAIPPGLPSAALDAIQALQLAELSCSIDPEQYAALCVEEKHFAEHRTRNNRTAHYMRLRRARDRGEINAAGWAFQRGAQPSEITQDIDETAKAIHYSHAEQAMGYAQPPTKLDRLLSGRANTAPESLVDTTPLDVRLAQAKEREWQKAHKWDAEIEQMKREGYLGDTEKSQRKQEINRMHEAEKMPAPYINPFDDSVEIDPDHLVHFGVARTLPSPDEPLFVLSSFKDTTEK
jgi:hypothetical protein